MKDVDLLSVMMAPCVPNLLQKMEAVVPERVRLVLSHAWKSVMSC